jgi:Flp pilus assembly protein TadB
MAKNDLGRRSLTYQESEGQSWYAASCGQRPPEVREVVHDLIRRAMASKSQLVALLLIVAVVGLILAGITAVAATLGSLPTFAGVTGIPTVIWLARRIGRRQS